MAGRWAALAVALGLAAAGCGDGSGEKSGGATPLRLRPGDCFDDPAAGAVTQSDLVPCEQPHDNEVFATIEHPAPPGEPFLGREALVAYGEQACAEAFADYVGKAYDRSRYSLFPVVPRDVHWPEGDRLIVCALYDHRAGKLTGPARGSGQ